MEDSAPCTPDILLATESHAGMCGGVVEDDDARLMVSGIVFRVVPGECVKGGDHLCAVDDCLCDMEVTALIPQNI